MAVQEDFLACMKLRMANILVDAEAVVAAMAVQHGLRRQSGATPSFSTFLISQGTNALAHGVLMSPLHASQAAIPRLKRPIRSLDMNFYGNEVEISLPVPPALQQKAVCVTELSNHSCQ